MMQLFGEVQDNDVIDASEISDLNQILASGKTLFGMEDYVFNLSDKLLNGDQANVASGIGNLAAGSSATTMDSLIGKWFLGTDRPDTGYSYTYTEGSLVVDGFSVDDVEQGNIGNCYFLTSLSSLAVNKPHLLQDMFIDNGDGTFTVKFYNQANEAEYVTVDRYLPTINNQLAYASQGATASDASNELWVALAEKAYAQLAESGWSRPSVYTTAYNTNSYAAIDTGWMNEAIDVLTDLTTYTYTLHPDAALTEAILANLVETDRLLTVGFTDGNGLVVDNHAYSMNSFDAITREFHLDNSWGFSDASLTWSELVSLGARLQYTNA